MSAVLRRFGMRPVPGVRITLIARDIHTPYSGMLPGLVAGHYTFDDVHIDLARLARFAGARLYHQPAVGLDLDQREVHCEGRPPVPYDLVSINVGSTPAFHGVPGAAEAVIPVKPIGRFVERWTRLRARVLSAEAPVRIGVVGAGAGGVELLLAVQFALGQMLAGSDRGGQVPEMHLFGAGEIILPTHNPGVRQRLERVLRARGVHLHLGQPVTAVRESVVVCGDGAAVRLDEILWVTQAGAPSWPRAAGLAVDDEGFIEVDDTLRSTSHPDVFAAGDVAAVVGNPREKAGVFAVRQGPPLARNLRRALLGRRPRPFHPQRRFLTLVSTGDRHAVGGRGTRSFEGALAWRWKDWIDRRFMAKYADLPEMRRPTGPAVSAGLAGPEDLQAISTAAMRCGGCGSKVGATPLDRVLARLTPVRRDDVLIGLDAPDDAAVVRVPPGKLLVRTVDAFRAIVDDPFVFGEITANHCLGDIFAMGAEAQTALAVATVPFGLGPEGRGHPGAAPRRGGRGAQRGGGGAGRRAHVGRGRAQPGAVADGAGRCRCGPAQGRPSPRRPARAHEGTRHRHPVRGRDADAGEGALDRRRDCGDASVQPSRGALVAATRGDGVHRRDGLRVAGASRRG